MTLETVVDATTNETLQDMSREQLIALVEALDEQNARLLHAMRSHEVTNKQVYTAIRNYVANELGLGNTEIKAMIEAATMTAVERLIIQGKGENNILDRALAKLERTIERHAVNQVQTYVTDYLKKNLQGFLRISVDFKQPHLDEKKEQA